MTMARRVAVWCLVVGSCAALLGGSRRRACQTRRATSTMVLSLEAQQAWFAVHPNAASIAECTEDGCVVKPLKLDPLEAPSVEDQTTVSGLLDWMHTQLLKLSPTADDEDDNLDNFAEFISEGRSMLAITSSRVIPGATPPLVVEELWTAIADLLRTASSTKQDTGLLIVVPDYAGDLAAFIHDDVLAPLSWMGWNAERLDFAIYGPESGSPVPAFRLIILGDGEEETEGGDGGGDFDDALKYLESL